MDNISSIESAVTTAPMEVSRMVVPFGETGYFTKIIIDYVNESDELKEFYQHAPSFEGIEQAILSRKNIKTDRKTLVTVLESQYSGLPVSPAVHENIRRLKDENTFTVTTAHQPNIFTGYLYFIYKILHAVKLAASLNNRFPENHFVPVYYMGSEDADLDELGNIYLDGEKTVWNTDQKGAVGRMKTKGLEKIIQRLEGELNVEPHGKALTTLLKDVYLGSDNIQIATLKLVNAIFAEYGVVVLIPDSPALKKATKLLFLDDLVNQTASSIVDNTIKRLSAHYKVQANPREINLFYLKENIRERIVKTGSDWKVIGTDIHFSEEELKNELSQHPERFSPNVILRGLFQETILPNIVFIGGGGELAYWLELKDLFRHYQVPYPVLMLRNSFLLIGKKWKEKMLKLGFHDKDLLKEEEQLKQQLVKTSSSEQLELNKELQAMQALYQQVKSVASRIDKSLDLHVAALETRATEQLKKLEKKMLRSEKKKFETQLKQLELLRKKLFPNNNLQERVDNFMPYYAKRGNAFIEMLYQESFDINKGFIILSEK